MSGSIKVSSMQGSLTHSPSSKVTPRHRSHNTNCCRSPRRNRTQGPEFKASHVGIDRALSAHSSTKSAEVKQSSAATLSRLHDHTSPKGAKDVVPLQRVETLREGRAVDVPLEEASMASVDASKRYAPLGPTPVRHQFHVTIGLRQKRQAKAHKR